MRLLQAAADDARDAMNGALSGGAGVNSQVQFRNTAAHTQLSLEMRVFLVIIVHMFKKSGSQKFTYGYQVPRVQDSFFLAGQFFHYQRVVTSGDWIPS